MEKINIEEILLQNHFHILKYIKTVYSPDTHDENMYERLMNGINDICKQILELAAENAEDYYSISDEKLDESLKQSILDTINQIE